MSGTGIARLGVVAWLAAAAVSAQPAEPWRILVLDGGEPFNPGSSIQEEAFRTALLATSPRPVTFHVEFLDSISFDTTRFEPELLAFLRKKYAAARIDLVVPVGPVALLFAESHQRDMWPEASVVFFSVSKATLDAHPPGPVTTGVMIGFDGPGTLALARRMQRQARRLLLVSGASDYDRGWEPFLQDAVEREGQGLEVERSFGEPLPEVLRRVAALPKDSMVVYATINRDGRGRRYVPRDVAEQLGQASASPIYSVMESQLGHGVVGGSMAPLAAGGQRAAALALRVLRGEKAAAIPVEPPPKAVPMVDWRQLRRFGLSEAALPPGSIVLDRSPSLWEEYRRYVAAAGAMLVVQTGLVVALLGQSRRRKQAEVAPQRPRAQRAPPARTRPVR